MAHTGEQPPNPTGMRHKPESDAAPDHYSAVARQYAAFRPAYPAVLFEWLTTLSPSCHLAWDCGTGSGQAAIGLAERFHRVHATDPSTAQLERAPIHPRITYRGGGEADSGLPDQSAALVTAAQAAHWFDLPAFYREADRVLTPDGILAIWSYGAPRTEPAIDRRLDWFRGERVGSYWPPGREHVDDGYRHLPFPFPEIPAPAFSIEMRWSLAQLLGYVRSWSAVARCRQREGRDPVDELAAAIAPDWGEPSVFRRITWEIALRVGRKPDSVG
ncbi:MAG: class I SAM-dependent methyltransferase [Gemmatimonadota bacterium]|nr:class I SAM-dependent methyltransferase [Gemmatimonadota bacterium]